METIVTPTGDVKKSMDFYNRAGFEQISKENPLLYSDGNYMVEIEPSHFARTGLKFYCDNIEEVNKSLSKLTKTEKTPDGYVASDPNGIKVYLVEARTDKFDFPKEKKSILGNFAGISIEAVDFDQTEEFWKCLGYKLTDGSKDVGWATYSNDTSIDISIMRINTCPHLFFNPGLTYFNGSENLKVIEKVRKNGIEITEEITHFNSEGIVDNIIIRDPGGIGFFLFSD